MLNGVHEGSMNRNENIKVGTSSSEKKFFISFNDSPSKMMKNAF